MELLQFSQLTITTVTADVLPKEEKKTRKVNLVFLTKRIPGDTDLI